MKQVRLTEVYHNNDLAKIEASDAETGAHVIDALWDPTDEQTQENRLAFRTWFTTMLARKGYEPLN